MQTSVDTAGSFRTVLEGPHCGLSPVLTLPAGED